MRESRDQLEALTRLHRIFDADERRVVFRQAFSTLAAAASAHRPVPLEGLDPAALREATRIALASGLLDDLDWLAPDHAAAATYELAAALPPSDEKRELGRRVLRALYEGNASTFTSVATLLALGSRRGLSGPAIRARVALSLDLPIGSGTRADSLALALIARRDLADEWLVTPSMGGLPNRRLASRLLERAAREAARRAMVGDRATLKVFERPEVVLASERLLSDREPLVWRHAASARGLLSKVMPLFEQAIQDALDPNLTPTQWRRAAASLAASIALDPEPGSMRCAELLSGDLFASDPGIASAMILGTARAAEAEPEAAEELLTSLVSTGGLDAIEALIEIRNERLGAELGEWAARLALARLRDDEILNSNFEDDGREALLQALDTDLSLDDARAHRTPSLRERLEAAKVAFVEEDARAAFAKANEVLAAIDSTLQLLESCTDADRGQRLNSFWRLRDLDLALLETSTLVDLLHLESHASKDNAGTTRILDSIFGRLSNWLIARERAPIDNAQVAHPMLRARRMRALLHLVDADGSHLEERSPELRQRRLITARFLLDRARDDVPSSLRRLVCAAAARACDAILREEVAELADVLMAVGWQLHNEQDLATIGEASMVPEAAAAFHAYAQIVGRVERTTKAGETRGIVGLEALHELADELPGAGSPRVEALRLALDRFATTLDAIHDSVSLVEISGSDDESQESLLEPLGDSVNTLARMVSGARRRLGEPLGWEAPVCGAALHAIDVALLQGIRSMEPASDALDPAAHSRLAEAVHVALAVLRHELPIHLAEVACSVLNRVLQVPVKGRRRSQPPVASQRVRETPLPPWLPPSRILGGFYVLRALGAGAVGTVFVARRAEDRNNERAERFALKVPEYAGSAARTLSESEFLQLFREEAGALLAVPPHENLAKLVTFDVGAKPKPILVMELVEGPTFERLVETGSLHMRRAVRVLDGIASGLRVMHEIGVGHLDLKPSNVILRDPDGDGPLPEMPVLVDFGLAGRKLRPGCATSSYGAPEVWGLMPKGHIPKPMPADVYAFGCLAFEALTGHTLFWGTTDLAIITSHLQHDGDLAGLDSMLRLDKRLAPLVHALRGALRQDPRKRADIVTVQETLRSSMPILTSMTWPLPIPATPAAA